MVSKKFTDRSDVEKTLKQNPLWQNLPKEEFRTRLKEMLETNQSLTDDAKEYIRGRLKE